MLAAIEETVVASGVGGVQGMGRREYEGVERRMEMWILGRGGRV